MVPLRSIKILRVTLIHLKAFIFAGRFYEWYIPGRTASGAADFKELAGVSASAIIVLNDWSRLQRRRWQYYFFMGRFCQGWQSENLPDKIDPSDNKFIDSETPGYRKN